MEDRMKRLFALALLCSCLAIPAAQAEDAPSPNALRAAEELSAMVNADTMSQMSSEMTAQIWPSIENSLVSKVDAATLAELRGEFERSVAAFAGETMKYAPAVYARHFSAQELHEIVAFYRTQTGAKALHVMPKVMGDVMAQMGPRVQAFQEELNTKIVAILQKHGYKN
jgi:uncharacterized protein